MKELKLNMNTNFIKLIAIITMTIDHIGYVFFPDILIFRIIGRIAFPLFVYSMMIGYFRTKDLTKYIVRLLIIGIISQFPYSLLFNVCRPNVMFSLIVALLFYYSLDEKKWWIIPFLVVIPFLLNFEYSIIYLFLVPIFYYFRNNGIFLSISFILFYLNYLIYPVDSFSIATFFTILCLPFILIKTNINIKINKYFYYLYYPVHITVLLIIKYLI
mgnify:CR=1 FL=1